MLMEATGHLLFTRTRLISPAVTSQGPLCLTFFYYMYGQMIRQLNVYSQPLGQSRQLLWQRTGDQGANWLVGQVTINSAGNTFQVCFLAFT